MFQEEIWLLKLPWLLKIKKKTLVPRKIVMEMDMVLQDNENIDTLTEAGRFYLKFKTDGVDIMTKLDFFSNNAEK